MRILTKKKVKVAPQSTSKAGDKEDDFVGGESTSSALKMPIRLREIVN